jgi:hypothetical protein
MRPINKGLKGPGMESKITEISASDKYLRYGFAKNNKRLNSFFFCG